MPDFLSEKEYKELVDFTKILIGFKNDHIQAGDIINDVLLEAMERGDLLYVDNLKKAIRFKTRDFISNKQNTSSIRGRIVLNNSKIYAGEHFRTCINCKEDLPISAFSVVNRRKKTGDAYETISEVLYNCKVCQKNFAKQYREKKKTLGIKQKPRPKSGPKKGSIYKNRAATRIWRDKNRNNAHYKAQNALNVSKWLDDEKNREKWNEYVKKKYVEKKKAENKKKKINKEEYLKQIRQKKPGIP
jgi:hypothetical protein